MPLRRILFPNAVQNRQLRHSSLDRTNRNFAPRHADFSPDVSQRHSLVRQG